MIVEAGIIKAIAAGGGLVSSIALLAGMAGGGKYAAGQADQAALSRTACAYAGEVQQQQRSARGLGLTKEQQANARIIVDVAEDLRLPKRAAIIGVATGLQESFLKSNVVGDNGQAHGVFQQHPQHGWGTHAQVTNTAYAARTFYNRLVKVKDWDTKPLTVAAQSVQRSAWPNAYAKHESRAQRIVTALTTAPPRVKPIALAPRDEKTVKTSVEAAIALGIPKEVVVADVADGLQAGELPSVAKGNLIKTAERLVAAAAAKLCATLRATVTEAVGTVTSAVGKAAVAVSAAMDQRGTRYSWGGGGPSGPSYGIGRGANTKGFDCSGLTEFAWSKAGVRIGGTTYEQVNAGTRVPRGKVQPGDLVFYETDSSRSGPDHVGLAISKTKMVNAPYTGAVVRVDKIDRSGYSGAVRP